MTPVTAIIPARGGSKRLPGKALHSVGGKTLLGHAIDNALTSGRCDRIIVSSDDDAILLEGARYNGVEVRHRPAAFATDTATTMDVIVDLLENPGDHPLATGSDRETDTAVPLPEHIIVLLQPTCPFRTGADIASVLDLLEEQADAAITVSELTVPPQRALRLETVTSRCLIDPTSDLVAGRTRKQQYEPWYAPNGAVYAASAARLLQVRSFFLGDIRAHVMPAERSLDIDSAQDLHFAQFLFAREDSA